MSVHDNFFLPGGEDPIPYQGVGEGLLQISKCLDAACIGLL
jgi:hypothetical protein